MQRHVNRLPARHSREKGEEGIMRKIRTPYFETGVKCYLYGQDVIDYALECDAMAEKYDIDILFISNYTELREVKRQTKNLIVMAPYMDNIRRGRGMGLVLPEALADAGADGVLLNHCEKPMSREDVAGCIERAREVGMFSFVCAGTVEEAEEVARLNPDIINPEPPEFIGSGHIVGMDFVRQVCDKIRKVNPNIYVELAAGASTGEDLYQFLMNGSDGAGAASGVINAPDPHATLDEMLAAVARAKRDLGK